MFTMKTLRILSISIFCVFPSLHGDNLQFYRGPRDKSSETFQVWFSEFSRLRDQIEAGLDLGIYHDFPEISWARTSFIQPQVMIHDRQMEYENTNLTINFRPGFCLTERLVSGQLTSLLRMSPGDTEAWTVSFSGRITPTSVLTTGDQSDACTVRY